MSLRGAGRPVCVRNAQAGAAILLQHIYNKINKLSNFSRCNPRGGAVLKGRFSKLSPDKPNEPISGYGRDKLTKLPSCPDKSESLGFPRGGMKFDVVTQWVIA